MVGIPILVCGFHDILVVNHLRDRREGLIIQYSAIPAAILFSWFLVRRFLQSINRAERLTESLEERVKAREQEIRQQYDRLAQLENERVLSTERERIMRDMHDGIGGQLLSLRALLQDQNGQVFGQIEEKVTRSLTDLRLVIDSLDPVLSDMPTLLGMMRQRFEEQLSGANVRLRWDVNELTRAPRLNPERSLHLLRILQEAVTNIIKHAGATEMVVRAVEDQHTVVIEIRDNGVGFPEAPDHGQGSSGQGSSGQGSRGLTNMRYRAAQMGAEIQFDRNTPGACVRLILHE